MSQVPDGKNSAELPDREVVPAGDSGPGTVPAVWVDVSGHERTQQATLGTGAQHNYFGGVPAEAETPVSIAPPAGQRDGRFPLRGRDEVLSDLLAVHDGPRVRVIHGMGGCGKTSLVLEAGHLARERGAEVWWVSAAEKSRLLAGMRAIGRRLGVSDDELRHGEAADLLWRRLSEWSQPWLLVIDSADDPQILAGPGFRTSDGTGWLRPVTSPAGLVLVTSRDGDAANWGSWCRLYSIGMLAAAEAVQVLADRTGVHHNLLGGNTGAESLAGRLGRLPLALRLAGSFLAESAEIPPAFADPTLIRSYLKYREILEQGDLRAAFPSRAPGALTPDEARGIIDRTWELTLDQLDSRQCPEARRLLRLLAWLGNAPIPHELLLHPPTLARSPLFADITGPRLWQVLQALTGFGLIELASSQDQSGLQVIRLHPLVRDTNRAGSREPEQEEYLTLAASLVGAAAASEALGSPEDPITWRRWQALAPHALDVFQTLTAAPGYPDEALMAAAYAANETATYQAAQGLISTAEATHQAVLRVRLRILGADHPDTIATRHSIARRLAERADYGAAESEYRGVLEVMQRVLGAEAPDTLMVQHNLAALVSFRGDYAQAEADYRDVLAIKLRVLGRDHQDTLVTRHEIARMMSEQGHYAAAEAEFRGVLETRTQTLGPDHYYTLITRSQLARNMAAQGQHARAETEFREILTAQRRLLGPDHLRTLWTRQQIALMRAAQGDYAEAGRELNEVLAVRQAKIPDHPDTLATRHELARVLAARGNSAAARAEFQAVLTAKIRVLGPDHPSTALTRREIESLTDNPASAPTPHGEPSGEPGNWI